MTAEVAILNKTAVALAADSAVSIGAPPNYKIYNTVNKIFELSLHDPVGIMIYGRLDFMGLPLETLIKEFRVSLKPKSFETIEEYNSAFCNFLSSSVPYSEFDDYENIGVILYDLFSKANAEIDELILADIMARGSFKKSKINSIIQKHIREKIKHLQGASFVSGLNKKSIPPSYAPIVDKLIDECFRTNTPTESSKKLLKEYAGYFLSKAVLSDYRSGIVIAGFGTKELCPTLVSFEMDGIVAGKLKLIRKQSVDIGRQGPHAEILGFAQDDMMKSFVNGIDPVINSYFDKVIKESVKETASLILGTIISDKAALDTAIQTVDGELTKISDDISLKSRKYIQEKSTNPIRDMVRAMPKQELATLASSLIEITSLKRKVTRAQETVGGEVDVAIISKSEGFVWTKRKHYFPAELNKRFFVRHFGVS